MKKLVLYAIVFFPVWVFSQTYTPHYKQGLSVNNDSSSTLNNYQTLFNINTEALILSGHLKADGSDIRFTPVGCTPTVFYDYWIESGLNTDSTRIWVKIPTINALGITELMLWYGDTGAVSTSNFNATFPNAFISGGNDTTLSGIIYYDWFQLDTGDVIYLAPNLPLQINARVVNIAGKVDGKGKGFDAPFTQNNGNGSGGGGMSTTAGAGGGSYGGFGGSGGYDFGDIPGNGGPIYGLINDNSYLTGSSGGSTDNAVGGNGGGAICINSEWINILGNIDMSGNNGVGLIGRCGGGGSGGTILLNGENITIDTASILSVNGGKGGSGASAAHDGGGGGAGGRIKFFYKFNVDTIGNIDYTGGTGGLYGSAMHATNGDDGTFINEIKTFYSVSCTNTGELALQANIQDLDSFYCLNKDTVFLFATPQGGTFSGTGVVSNYFFPLLAGVGVHPITYLYNDPWGCGNLYDTVTVEVLNVPTFPAASSNSPVCEGTTVLLSASDSTAQHYWTGPNGFTSTHQQPIIPSSTTTDGGNYTVTITNAAGCSSTVVTNVIVNAAPFIGITNNGPICIQEDLILIANGGDTYHWTGPNGFASTLPSPTIADVPLNYSGTYTVTVTSPNGCISTATTNAQIDGCYDNIENHEESFVKAYPNPAVNDFWLDITDEGYSGDLNFTLTDMSGKIVKTGMFNSNDVDRYSIHVSELDRGIYILMIVDGIRSKKLKIMLN